MSEDKNIFNKKFEEIKEKIEIKKQQEKIDVKKEINKERNIEQKSNIDSNLNKVEKKLEEKGDEQKIGGIISAGKSVSKNKQRYKKIESILSNGFEDAYLKMSPEKKVEFKLKGEETSNKINELIEKGKITLKKVVRLIKKWLSIIPGVNKYFLEQEAKIKADEIVKLNNDK